jgi:predicted nucleic acid-binding protein
VHLVDTSVWIEFLRTSGSAVIQARLRPLLLQGQVAAAHWLVLELMTGLSRTEKPAHLLDRLSPITRLPFPDDAWPRAWDLASRLRKHGVTPTAADCFMATVAMEADVPLIHCDGDFEDIRKYSALRTIDWRADLTSRV